MKPPPAVRPLARASRGPRAVSGVLSLIAFLAALSALPAPPAAAPLSAQALPGIDDRDALESFVTGVVRGYMAADHISGVTVSVVHDGEVALLAGYGLADRAGGVRVDPERSLFRIGSVSKTFTWTAIMQLVEEGRLSLDDPVNDHLPPALRVPDQGYDEPIRVRHLMTHSPGFEDTALGHLFVRDPGAVLSLEEYLARYRPARVRPPGVVTAYSNYGVSLAGAVVSAVAGVPFETYLERRILEPLGMDHTTFREPLGEDAEARGLPAPMREDLRPLIARGYHWERGGYEEGDYEFITHTGPAGAGSSTARDMATYMLAHLRLGAAGEGAPGDGGAASAGGAAGSAAERILALETAERMRTRLFSNHDAVNGLAHGFMEYSLPGGHRGIGHGGATLTFMTNMVMVPELDLGVFISTNTGTGMELALELPKLVVERFFAGPAGGERERQATPRERAASGGGQATSPEELRRLAGTYLSNRRSHTTVEKAVMGALPGMYAQVSVLEDSLLVTEAAGEATRWRPLAPDVFAEVDGVSVMAFRLDEEGRPTHLFEPVGVTALERVGFLQTGLWLLLILLLVGITGIGILVGAWRRRREPLRQTDRERWAARVLVIYGLGWLAFLAGLVGAGIGMAAAGMDVVFDFPSTGLLVALALGVVAAVLTVLAVLGLVPVWRRGSWTGWRRLRYTLAVALGVAAVATLHWWNMLGFQLP